MITVHHLGVSQSDRIVWLLEELHLPYALAWYDRHQKLAPADYLALHPAATAPVVTIDGRNHAESAAIVQYICDTRAEGALTLKPGDEHYFDYLYWMNFNNNVQGLFLCRALQTAQRRALFDDLILRRESAYFNHLETTLSRSEHVAGDQFSAADIMVAFNLTTLPLFGGRAISDLPHTQRYVDRLASRPAYQKAMALVGPTAIRPLELT